MPYGFTPPLCNHVKSYLSVCFISVVVDDATSAPFSVFNDVPQGFVLSPMLFLLFSNDFLSSTASRDNFSYDLTNMVLIMNSDL